MLHENLNIRSYLYLTLIHLSVLLLCMPAFVSAQQLSYKTYTVNEGLAQNTVWDVCVDFKGFLWIGTADGINRFDGDRMHLYASQGTGTSFMRADVLYRFHEDKRKQFWVVSNLGLGYYNRSFDSFSTVYISRQFCSFIGEDDKGRIWIADGDTKILIIDALTKKIVRSIPIQPKLSASTGSIQNSISLPGHFVTTLNDKVILVIDKKTERPDFIYSEEGNGSCIGYINDSTLTSFLKGMRYVYHLRQNRIVTERRVMKNFTHIPSFSSYQYSRGELYASSIFGLYILDKESLEVKRAIFNFSDSIASEFSYIQTLKVAPDGIFFMAYNGAGLKIYSPYSNKFKHYHTSTQRGNMVKSICRTADGKVITGLWGSGLTIYDSVGKYKFLSLGRKNEINSVFAIRNWDKQHVLFTHGNELVWFNHVSGQVLKRIKLQGKAYFPFPQFEQNAGQLLVNYDSSGYGIIAGIDFDKGMTNVVRLKAPNVRCFKWIDSQTCWIGGSNALLRYNVASKKTDTFLRDHIIKCILLSSENRLLIGTTRGLCEINREGKLLHQWTLKDGLINDLIYGILEDKNKALWMSHNKGISRLNLSNNKIQNFGVQDGLQSNEFNTGAFYKDEEGLLYFGGINGFNIVDPEHIPEDNKPIPVSINQININDLPYITDSSCNELRQLNLNYGQNTLSFNFAALEFCRPEACKYRYKLEGYDKQWIESATIHFARYANIAPGNYTFKILACNPDGYWAINPKELNIYIKAPFWQTLSFRLAILFLGLLLVILVINALVNRQKLKAKRQLAIQIELEAERLRISRDLHDNVGAHLSYLINNIDWMKEHPNTLKEYEKSEKLKLLGEAGRNALHTLRQTIWAFSQSAISVDDFADRFKQFALKMLELNESVQVDFEEQLTINNQLNPSQALNLFRIAQEAFNNSLKHSGCSRIEVLFLSTQDCLFQLRIRDNGKGFVPEQYKDSDSYGLQNMLSRAQETGAHLLIDSEIGKGTSITINITK